MEKIVEKILLLIIKEIHLSHTKKKIIFIIIIK